MAGSLNKTIADLAEDFVAGVLAAIRTVSLDEISGLSSRAGAPRGRTAAAAAPASRTRPDGRRIRRSADAIDTVAARIVALVAKQANGIRAEQIRAKLDIDKRDLLRPLNYALEMGSLTKSGERRATTYFAGNGTPMPQAKGAKKLGKKAAGKPGKRGAKKASATNGESVEAAAEA